MDNPNTPLSVEQRGLIQMWLDSGFHPTIGRYDSNVIKLSLQAFLYKGEYSQADKKTLDVIREKWIDRLKNERK